nr:hypothetical protein [uncultured Anaerobutyricum sp.]
MKQRVKKDLENQYASSEEWIERETEQFFMKQGRIILAEVVIGIILLIILIFSMIFFPKYIVFERNPFGQGMKEIQVSLKKDKENKKINYKLSEQELSDKQIRKIYKQFFKELKRKVAGKNTGLNKVTTSLSLPENIEGYPFEIAYEFLEDGYIFLDGTLNKKEQNKLKNGESHITYITVKASYKQYEEIRKYKIQIFSKPDTFRHNKFYKVEQYLKKKEQKSRYGEKIRIPTTYKGIQIGTGQNGIGSMGLIILFITIGLLIPLHNYMKLREKGDKCQIEAERDFPVIVHLLTLYMGAGLSFFSAVRRISNNYQRQKKQSKQKKYAFERIMLMEQQMNNGISQKEACHNWGMQFRTDSYQKLSLILIQSFTKGAKEAAVLMETEEKEAFRKRVDRARKEGEEAATRLLFPMILLLSEVMLLVMYPALIRFQGF